MHHRQGQLAYDKNTATLHLCLGGIPEKVAYHELIHRAQSNTPELQNAYAEFKGGLWGRAKNANADDYYGSVIEQMAYAGADVQWLSYCGRPKSLLQTNRRNRDFFTLPQPDPQMCFVPDGYDHSRYEEAYFNFVKEYIDLLPEEG